MLPVVVDEPFDSPDHIFEVKWAGVRAIASIEDGAVRLHGRNLRDLTPLYPELAKLPGCLGASRAVLDGEIVAWGGEELPSVDLLRPRLLQPDQRPKSRRAPVLYQVFDLLALEGRWLLEQRLVERRNRLHKLIRPSDSVQAADFVREDGVAFFEAAAGRGLEGIVAKHVASPYLPGERSDAWREVRASQSDDFVVGGYSFGGGRRRDPIGTLLLGAYRGERLEYVGQVSVGTTDREAKQLLELLTPLHSGEPPFAEPPALDRFLYWCRPELACHVRYGGWQGDGTLRFPVFVAPRPDVPPDECIAPDR